ncbi:hypothetical protein QLX08_003833 [Tetragonisca angustula]|uniref:Elongation of very long chain fatty acids protein n=1 Tax=Tetragonisca angustula TaxID=166442 RepID=A0AAW1A797_9HYME
MNKVIQIIPNYSYVFNFEKGVAYQDILATITRHYPKCFYCSAMYIALTFAGKRYMSNRLRFELRGMLILWNAFLALFSIFGFIRMGSEMSHVLRHYGFYHSICLNSLFLGINLIKGKELITTRDKIFNHSRTATLFML